MGFWTVDPSREHKCISKIISTRTNVRDFFFLTKRNTVDGWMDFAQSPRVHLTNASCAVNLNNKTQKGVFLNSNTRKTRKEQFDSPKRSPQYFSRSLAYAYMILQNRFPRYTLPNRAVPLDICSCSLFFCYLLHFFFFVIIK